MNSNTASAGDSSSTEFTSAVSVGPLLGFIVVATLAGAALGAATNAITASFAADYFRVVMGWWELDDLWRAAVAEGVFAGLLTGFFGALVFCVFVGITTGCRASFATLARALILAGSAALVGWVLGGLIGIGLAHLSPERFENTLPVPEVRTIDFDATTYGWAGGSLAGLFLGALAAAVVGAVRIRARWKLVLGAG